MKGCQKTTIDSLLLFFFIGSSTVGVGENLHFGPTCAVLVAGKLREVEGVGSVAEPEPK